MRYGVSFGGIVDDDDGSARPDGIEALAEQDD
jgi:hypothetical protein